MFLPVKLLCTNSNMFSDLFLNEFNKFAKFSWRNPYDNVNYEKVTNVRKPIYFCSIKTQPGVIGLVIFGPIPMHINNTQTALKNFQYRAEICCVNMSLEIRYDPITDTEYAYWPYSRYFSKYRFSPPIRVYDHWAVGCRFWVQQYWPTLRLFQHYLDYAPSEQSIRETRVSWRKFLISFGSYNCGCFSCGMDCIFRKSPNLDICTI